MEVSLDTSQYRADELNVSIADGAVTIQRKHEEKPEDVVSNLSSDGVLVGTANKANPAIDVKINQK